MTDFTRRTRMVRVPLDDPPAPKGQKPGEYMDIEVMEAVSFRIENNNEVILSIEKKSVPYIVDDTGGGHGKTPADATQRTHMQRIVSGGQKLDVEVLDCWSARDQNGDEWVLDMQETTVFDISDGTGRDATRRAHDEIVSIPPGKTKAAAGNSYVTSQRSDNIGFRKAQNDEVIINIPSCDDPHSPNVTFGRASTHLTPEGYDPADDSADAVAPPLLADSGDLHNYVARVKGASGFLTKDQKIAMGPLWWIRKVVSGSAYILFHLVSLGAPPEITVRDGKNVVPFLFDKSDNTGTTDVVWYVWQPATPNVQVVLITGGLGFVTYGSATLQDSLAGRTIQGYGDNVYGDGRPAPTHNNSNQFFTASGVDPSIRTFQPRFETQADAQVYADFLNNWTAFAGTTPQLVVGATTQNFNRFSRDVAIKCGTAVTLTAEVTLAPDPNDSTSIGGGFQAQIYSIDTTSKTPVPDPITDLSKPPFLFNSEGVGSGESTTYTIKVSRDTDPTDIVEPTTALRLLVDVSPGPNPA